MRTSTPPSSLPPSTPSDTSSPPSLMASTPKIRTKPKGQGGFAAWYDRVASFNIETLFVKKKEPGPPRTIFVNEDLPQDYFDVKGKVKKENVYSSNQVVTSKYTFITFLPRNLLEQFRRIANMCVLLTFSLCLSSEVTFAQFLLGYCYPAVLPSVQHHLTRTCHIATHSGPRHHCGQRRL